MVSRKILLDSSVVIAFYNIKDIQYKKALKEVQSLAGKNVVLHLHPLIILETLTVLKQKIGKEGVLECEKDFLDANLYVWDKVSLTLHETDSWRKIFYEKNTLSVIDAMLLRYAIENDLELVTFDKELEKVYKRERRN